MNIKEPVGVKGTRIRIYNSSTGELIHEGHNKTVIAGSSFLVRKLFAGLSNSEEITPTYNSQLGLENSLEVVPSATPYIYLFAIGTDGCGAEPSQRYEVSYPSWIPPASLIPFRYTDLDMDIPTSLRDMYYGRAVRTNKIAYYFKHPENIGSPEYIQQYLDGTPIDSSIYLSSRRDECETTVELHLKITKEDTRQFFRATTGINSAKVNSLEICTAWPKIIDGYTYYQDIRPFSKYNFGSIPLIDPELGFDILYDFFF